MQEIVLLGSGQVAHHLAIRLSALEGYRLVAIYSRRQEHAERLARSIEAQEGSSRPGPRGHDAPLTTSDLSALPRSASYYTYALSDSALESVWAAMPETQGVWIHTAGSVSLEAMARWHRESGVLYPLQTFSQTRNLDWSDIPIYIEGAGEDTLEAIRRLALALSPKVYQASTTDRGKLHLAAVLACNFTNHLVALAESYLAQEGFETKSLMPLIRETMLKLETLPAIDAQTGPARRGDESTIQRHLALLEPQPELRALYQALSQSITNLYSPQRDKEG